MSPPLLHGFDFAALADALAALGADGWLVYDFRKVNPIAERILGATGMGTRRLFVLLPRAGRPIAVNATPDGAACALYGTAFAELLRLLVGLEGAMLHTACRTKGGDRCEWRAAPPDPRHH